MKRTRIERVTDFLAAAKAARKLIYDMDGDVRTFDREVAVQASREILYDEVEKDCEPAQSCDEPEPKWKIGDRVTWESCSVPNTYIGGRVIAVMDDRPTMVQLDPPHSIIDPRIRPEGLRREDVVTPCNGSTGSDKGWMGTSTGRKFWPLKPRSSDVVLADVVRGLAMTCRYGGQVKRFYSVAEHCVLVSRHVAPELALKALFHDCAEAYIGDMIRPLKHQPEMKAFRDAEATIERAILLALRLWTSEAEHQAIKEIDNRILVDEIDALSATPDYYLETPLLKGVQPLGVNIVGYEPGHAEYNFFNRYQELTGVIGTHTCTYRRCQTQVPYTQNRCGVH